MFPDSPDEEYMQLESKVIKMLDVEAQMTSDSQLSAHARADRDEELFGFKNDPSWMRVRPDNGRGPPSAAQPLDDEEWQHEDEELFNHDKQQNQQQKKPTPPQPKSESPKKNSAFHQTGNTSIPNSTHNTTNHRTPNDNPNDFANLLIEDSQPAKQPSKPPVPTPQTHSATRNNDKVNTNTSKPNFDADEFRFDDNDEEPITKEPIKSSASTYDSRQNSPTRSVPSTPVASSQGSAPQTKQPPSSSASQTSKLSQYSYNDDDDYLDSLQVEDEEMETLSSKSNFAIPSSVTPPSSLDANKYSFLDEDDNLDLSSRKPTNTTKPTTATSTNSSTKPTNTYNSSSTNTTTNINDVNTTNNINNVNTTSSSTTSTNKRKSEGDEWDDYSFLEDMDDDVPPPTTNKKGIEDDKKKANTPFVDDEEDIPIQALTKRKKFVE